MLFLTGYFSNLYSTRDDPNFLSILVYLWIVSKLVEISDQRHPQLWILVKLHNRTLGRVFLLSLSLSLKGGSNQEGKSWTEKSTRCPSTPLQLLSRSYSSDSSFILKNSRARLSPIKNHGVIYLRLGYNRARIRLRGWAGIGVNNGQTARKVGHWRKRVANKQREIKVKTDWRVMSEEGGEKGRNKK